MKTRILFIGLLALIFSGCSKNDSNSGLSSKGGYSQSYVESTIRAYCWKNIFTDTNDDGYFEEKSWVYFETATTGRIHWYDTNVSAKWGTETFSGDRPFRYTVSGTTINVTFTDGADDNKRTFVFYDTYLKCGDDVYEGLHI